MWLKRYQPPDWSVWDSVVRNNDMAECNNFLLYQKLGAHPPVDKWLQELRVHAEDQVIRWMELKKYNWTRARDPVEVAQNQKLAALQKKFEDQLKAGKPKVNFLYDAAEIFHGNWKYLEQKFWFD